MRMQWVYKATLIVIFFRSVVECLHPIVPSAHTDTIIIEIIKDN